jgi:flagellar motor protein MotB
MRGRILKVFMVILVLVPVGLTAYLANSLYHRKGVPQALENLTRQLFLSKEEEKKAETRAKDLERKTEELQSAYDALVADLRGEVDSRQIRVRQFREKLEINFVDKVLFASGSADISPRGRDILSRVAAVLAKVKDKSIYVVGHTDNVPIHSSLYPSNWELSASRAASVIRHLSEAAGLPPERFTAMGRAFYQPVASNASPEGRQENRRVDIIVADVPLLTGEAGSQSLRGTVSGAPGADGEKAGEREPSGQQSQGGEPGGASEAAQPLRQTAPPPGGQTAAPPQASDLSPAPDEAPAKDGASGKDVAPGKEGPSDQDGAPGKDGASVQNGSPGKDGTPAQSPAAASSGSPEGPEGKSSEAPTVPAAGQGAAPAPPAAASPELPPPLPDMPATPAGS